MYYRMKVAGLERDLPICPLNENLSIAGFVIFGDPELTAIAAEMRRSRRAAYQEAMLEWAYEVI